MMVSTCHITSLPDEIFENILSYLSYNDVAILRQTSRFFDRNARCLLNKAFLRIERLVQQSLKHLRSQLPRRESLRRGHPLGLRVEHLSAIETRIGLLSMTYSRYISCRLCCFIPGKVLDELFHVFRLVQCSPSLDKSPFVLLRELRDISSMAIEHFDEHIAPPLCSRLTSSAARHRSSLSPLSSPSYTSLINQSNGSSYDKSHSLHALADSFPLSLGSSAHWTGLLASAAALASGHSPQAAAATTARSSSAGDTADAERETMRALSERVAAQDALIAQLTSRVTRLERQLTVDHHQQQQQLPPPPLPSPLDQSDKRQSIPDDQLNSTTTCCRKRRRL